MFVNGGSGYTTLPTIKISGGSGTGAVATCTRSGNSVNGINVTNYGDDYTTLPSVLFTQQYKLSNLIGGSGYTNAPNISFIDGGVAAKASLISGVVTFVAITTAGSGYTSPQAMVFTPTNGGSGASATVGLNTAATA